MEPMKHPHASKSPPPLHIIFPTKAQPHITRRSATYHTEVGELMEVDGAVADMHADPEEHLAVDADDLVRALAEMKFPSNYPSGFTMITMPDDFVYRRGTNVSDTGPGFDPQELLAANFGRALAQMQGPSNYPFGFTKVTTCNVVVYRRGTYVSGTDPCFDPLCIWGNDISVNKHQVRKLSKIVRRKIRVIEIKLFIYTLNKTSVKFRMEWRQ